MREPARFGQIGQIGQGGWSCALPPRHELGVQRGIHGVREDRAEIFERNQPLPSEAGRLLRSWQLPPLAHASDGSLVHTEPSGRDLRGHGCGEPARVSGGHGLPSGRIREDAGTSLSPLSRSRTGRSSVGDGEGDSVSCSSTLSPLLAQPFPRWVRRQREEPVGPSDQITARSLRSHCSQLERV